MALESPFLVSTSQVFGELLESPRGPFWAVPSVCFLRRTSGIPKKANVGGAFRAALGDLAFSSLLYVGRASGRPSGLAEGPMASERALRLQLSRGLGL